MPGVPPSLIAAVRAPRAGGEPVLVRTGSGREVIAVVTGRGDPAVWWATLQAWL